MVNTGCRFPTAAKRNGVNCTVNAIVFSTQSIIVAGHFANGYAYSDTLESIGYWNQGSFRYSDALGCSRRNEDGDIEIATVYDVAQSTDKKQTWIAGNFSGYDGYTHYGLSGSSGYNSIGPGGVACALEPVGNKGVFVGGDMPLNNPYGRPNKFTKILCLATGFAGLTDFMVSNGPSGTVTDLAYDSSTNILYISGNFTKVAEKTSPRFAAIQLDEPTGNVIVLPQQGNTDLQVHVIRRGNRIHVSAVSDGKYVLDLF